MEPVDPFDEVFSTPSGRLALELAREHRKLLADLTQLRRDSGVSQEELATRLGVSQATVSEFERVGNDPKLSTVRRYAHALGAMIIHQMSPSGVVEGSEDVTHFAGEGVETSATAAAAARKLHEQRRRETWAWNSTEAFEAANKRGKQLATAEAK